MDTSINVDATSSPISVHSEHESELNKSNTSRQTSAGKDTLLELESTGEIITRFELDVACVLEKLANLSLLLMHAEDEESDFETFDMDSNSCDLGIRALEFDFLSGFLDSELKELEAYLSDLLIDKAKIQELLSSRKHSEEVLVGWEDMLPDLDKSLEQSLQQVLEIKAQSAYFMRNLLRLRDKENLEDKDDHPELRGKMKMQTLEHQRHILRMLKKSLERELDLEKRVIESTQIEEALTMRLQHSFEQELLNVEEEVEIITEKFYERDHTSELLMGISKELLSKIQLLQFNLNGSVQREAGLSSKLQETIETLKVKENAANDLKERIVELEDRVHNEVKVDLLEKELNDTKLKLQNSEACVEASQEKQMMLDSMIKDMENVIEGLKEKASKAETQMESMEDKCIYLSEANAELVEELSFIKGRVKCLEAALLQSEESKKATAKDISLRTKLITDLVVQMALERERLQKQISSLKQENKTLVKRLKKMDKGPGKDSHGDKEYSMDRGLSETGLTAENKESLSTGFELGKAPHETVMSTTNAASEPMTVRNIDVRELRLKSIGLLILVLLIPLIGLLFYQIQVC